MDAELERLIGTPEAVQGISAPQARGLLARVASLLGQLAALQGALLVQLQHEGEPVNAPDGNGDRFITVEDAAAILGVDQRWLQRRYAVLPFVRRLDARTVRISEAALKRWMERQGRRQAASLV